MLRSPVPGKVGSGCAFISRVENDVSQICKAYAEHCDKFFGCGDRGFWVVVGHARTSRRTTNHYRWPAQRWVGICGSQRSRSARKSEQRAAADAEWHPVAADAERPRTGESGAKNDQAETRHPESGHPESSRSESRHAKNRDPETDGAETHRSKTDAACAAENCRPAEGYAEGARCPPAAPGCKGSRAAGSTDYRKITCGHCTTPATDPDRRPSTKTGRAWQADTRPAIPADVRRRQGDR